MGAPVRMLRRVLDVEPARGGGASGLVGGWLHSMKPPLGGGFKIGCQGGGGVRISWGFGFGV